MNSIDRPTRDLPNADQYPTQTNYSADRFIRLY